MRNATTSRPVLAGVCSRLAGLLRWNAWGVRAAWLVLLVFEPLIAIVAYLLLAAFYHLLDHRSPATGDDTVLHSPELAGRARRIAELDRRIGELR